MYWDVGLRGFGVRVAASGRKTFTVRYLLHSKRFRRDLGVYGVTIGYAAARAEAGRIISEARNDRDPFISSALLKKADVSTFEGLCAKYLADPAPGRKGRVLSAVTRAGMSRIIAKELIPVWGPRDPNSIQAEEIEAWVRGVASGEGRKKARHLASGGSQSHPTATAARTAIWKRRSRRPRRRSPVQAWAWRRGGRSRNTVQSRVALTAGARSR